MNIAKIEVGLENFAGKYLPRKGAMILRTLAFYPRFWIQLYISKRKYKKFGGKYPCNIIFVAGLPKSGTTWLEQVLANYGDFSDIYLPEIILYEIKHGDKLDIELPENIFVRFRKSLAVIKTHIRGLPRNIDLLRKSNVRYAVIYRDLRDVAVSYFFFVRDRPWHPEFKYYNDLTVAEGLKVFANRTLEDYSNWIREWIKNRDPQLSVEIKYEDMLDDPVQTFTNVLRHFQLDRQVDILDAVLNKYNTSFTSPDSRQSVQQQSVHFRKGVKGDWKNYMNDEIKQIYKEKVGNLLIELRYENDDQW